MSPSCPAEGRGYLAQAVSSSPVHKPQGQPHPLAWFHPHPHPRRTEVLLFACLRCYSEQAPPVLFRARSVARQKPQVQKFILPPTLVLPCLNIHLAPKPPGFS